jgi:hypothetical protein
MADETTDLPMTMRVYSQSGAYICEFPQFTNLQVMDTINDVGSFTFNWNLNAPGGSNLISDSALQMAVCADFKDGNGFTEVWRGWYEQDTYDPSNNESAIVQASGRSMVAVLGQAVVYPQGGVGNTTASWSFTGASVGTIMNTLLTAAQTRGCFPNLSWSFTDGHDSSGNAWETGYTNAFSAGTNYLDLLTGLAQGGLCDFNMTGETLNIYNPKTTLAQDFSSTVILRRSRDIVTISAQRDRTQISTAMLAVGDNGLNEEVLASTYDALGRYETYLSATGITDTATLTLLADQTLATCDDQQLSYTPTDVFNIPLGSNKPWKDFNCGDYISIDYAGTPVKFRCTAWTIQTQTGGPAMWQPTLNDVFYSREVLIQNQVANITSGAITGPGGIAVTGSGGLPVSGPNSTVPGVPAFTLDQCYTAAYYSPATGTTLAQLELTWETPTNTNGSTIIDGQNYLLQYRVSKTPIYPVAWSQVQGKSWASINGNPWSNVLDSPQNQEWVTAQIDFDDNNTIIQGLICGETYEFQIAATDVSGNTGLFSGIQPFATASDNVAPGQPDAPTVYASMVAVQVLSDLQLFDGGPLPSDLDHLEVHYSYDPAFTPVPGIGSVTYLGKIIANAGMINANIPAMGNFNMTSTTGVYIKVIAVDTSGNRSQASPSSGVTAVLIDDTHISSLSVSKLLAGTIEADFILGGQIATSNTGQRVVMDINGVHMYNSSGSVMFDVNTNSSVLVLGKSASGESITMDTSSFPWPTIFMNDPASTNPAYINAPAYLQTVGSISTTVVGLGLNMGKYISGIDNTTQVSQRVWMTGVAGIVVQIVNGSQLQHGGGLSIQDQDINLQFQKNGVQTLGQFDMTLNETYNDVMYTMAGFFNTQYAPNPDSGIIPQLIGGSSGDSGAIVDYGPSNTSEFMPIVQMSCSTTTTIPATTINGLSSTGYDITYSAAMPHAYTQFVSFFRIRDL